MRKNNLFVAKATLLFMGGLFLLSGCGDNKKKVSSEFACESVCYDDAAEKPARVFAYIDASGSMKGYFSLQSDGRFITALSDVNPDRINWMDNDFTKLEGVPTNSLLTNRFSGGQSRFDMMLSSIIKRDSLSKSDCVSLLFTDGILSASKKDTDINPNYMKQSFGTFKNMIAKSLKETPGIAIAIFQMESKYDGCYWNYENKDVSAVSIKDRPFYVIVMGKPSLIRHFCKNNKLKKSLYTAFGVNEKEIKGKNGTFFSPVVPQDFKGDKLVSNIIAFTLTLPDNVSQYGDAYIKKNIIITLDGIDKSQELKSLVSISGSQLTISNWNTLDPSCPIGIGQHTLKVEIPHVIPDEWTKLYSEDDLNIKNDMTQQKSTFALEYLIKGIQEGIESNNVLFSSSITFTK